MILSRDSIVLSPPSKGGSETQIGRFTSKFALLSRTTKCPSYAVTILSLWSASQTRNSSSDFIYLFIYLRTLEHIQDTR